MSAIKTSEHVDRRQIINSFNRKIMPVRMTLIYQISLFFLTLLMVLLPLIYLVLIAATGYGVYWHAVNNFPSMGHSGYHVMKYKIMIYLAPLIAGFFVVLTMLKPLVSRRLPDPELYVMTKSAEPFLFSFINAVCKAIRAPMPDKIELIPDCNASARKTKGLLKIYGKSLVLQIGIPLIAGLKISELTGILTHEFAHFRQGAGMMLNNIIYSINDWFFEVVYGTDGIDRFLSDSAEDSGWAMALILNFARMSAWLSKKILWVLMIIGLAASRFQSRHMEFNADKYAARVAGSKSFENALMELTLLELTSQKTWHDIAENSFKADDIEAYPESMRLNRSRIDRQTVNRIKTELMLQKTKWHDTHPSLKDRIGGIRKENSEGMIHHEDPASILLTDFNRTVKNAMIQKYLRS